MIKMIAPKEPNPSCPDLDTAIEKIENARRIHNQLRKWGNYWESKAEDLQCQLEELRKEMEDRVDYLQETISDLKNRIID